MRVLYASRSRSGHDERFIAAWTAAGWQVSALTLDGSNASLAELQHELDVFRPDVVQAGPVTDVAWHVAQCWAGPLIATSWGFDLMDEINRDRGLLSRASEVLVHADRVLVDNDAPRLRAIELGADPDRLVQFPWGVDLDRFASRTADIRNVASEDLPRIILCTRRHEDIYGVDKVLRAFINAAQANATIRLQLAGTGSLTAGLKQIAQESGLGDRVSFLGELQPSELAEAYRSADLYVSASSVDGTSVSLLEAMASGAPVLVSAIGGNQQWVTSNTGFSFALEDENALESFFARFALGEVELVHELRRRSTNALELVRTKADWSLNSKRLPKMGIAAINHRSGS